MMIDRGFCDSCVEIETLLDLEKMMLTPEIKHDETVDNCTNAGNENQRSVDKCEDQ